MLAEVILKKQQQKKDETQSNSSNSSKTMAVATSNLLRKGYDKDSVD